MTKEQYLAELRAQIGHLPESERQDILADYEEHFAAAREAGKSENEIARALGTPKSVAQSILMNSLVSTAETSPGIFERLGALGAILGRVLLLAPLNFFILFCPFLILIVLLFSGWVVPITIGLCVLFVSALAITSGLGGAGFFAALTVISTALGALGLSVLGLMIMFWITKAVLQVLISYFKWNLDFITSRQTRGGTL